MPFGKENSREDRPKAEPGWLPRVAKIFKLLIAYTIVTKYYNNEYYNKGMSPLKPLVLI